MKHFLVKSLVVVALTAGLGWFAGSVKSRPIGQSPDGTVVASDTFDVPGGTATITQTTKRHVAGAATKPDDTFHCWLHLDESNLGGPGELAVRGVYEIGVPNPVEIGDREYTIAVSVRGPQGEVIVDHDPVGVVVDRTGVGHWSEEFRWSQPFLPGKYYVEMLAMIPGTSVTRFDGRIGPFFMGYSSIVAVVK